MAQKLQLAKPQSLQEIDQHESQGEAVEGEPERAIDCARTRGVPPTV